MIKIPALFYEKAPCWELLLELTFLYINAFNETGCFAYLKSAKILHTDLVGKIQSGLCICLYITRERNLTSRKFILCEHSYVNFTLGWNSSGLDIKFPPFSETSFILRGQIQGFTLQFVAKSKIVQKVFYNLS